MTNCFLSGWPNSDGKQDSSFCSSLQIVIGFDFDHLIYNISLDIPYLFYEFQSLDIEGWSIIYHESFDIKGGDHDGDAKWKGVIKLNFRDVSGFEGESTWGR